jgi:hypothetical protein
MFEHHKKEAPFFTGIARGAGGFGFGKVAGGGASGPSFSATGGNVDSLEPGNGYVYHTFTSPGTFVVPSGTVDSEWFVVGPGGGGAGGNGNSGGGGGGGIVHVTGYSLVPGTYTITIPNGGSGGPSSNVNGNTGGDATVTHPQPFSLTGKGGGGGGGWTQPGGISGGSGGGGAGPSGSSLVGGPGIQPITPQTATSASIGLYGNPGGNGKPGPAWMGGGGGGSQNAGIPGFPGAGGDGMSFAQFTGTLIGVPSLNPLSGRWAGGGGGGSEAPLSNGAAGGLGGGGSGAPTSGGPGSPGTANSGGGGGAGTWFPGPSGTAGGVGGKGIVVVRYPSTGTSLNSTYRYWRIYKTNGAVGGPWTNEVQWTLHGSATYYQGSNYQNWTGSGLNSFNAAAVTDGNTSGNAFHTDTAGVGSYALLDLGAGNAKYFNKVEFWMSSSGVTATWNIQASNDLSSWTTFYTGLNVYSYTNISVTW